MSKTPLMMRTMRMDNFPIVKCSHCSAILAEEDFPSHKCSWHLKDVKQIPVVYFRDDSYEDKKVITGYGLDGILYTFVVSPKTAIPYFQKLTDESLHGHKTDEDFTEPTKETE